MEKAKLRGISVVIPCNNAAATIEWCLDAVARSKWTVSECIVVDDGSTDATVEKAHALGAKVVHSEKRRGPARARNIGAAHATCEIILFLDADVLLHEDAIERILYLFENDHIDAVIGAYDEAPAAASFVSQYRNLLHCFTHRRGQRKASTFWCGCGAIRRAVFLRRGGLPERYNRPSIEDVEFGHSFTAAGGSIVLDPAIQVKHLKCWTFASMLRTDLFDRAIPWARLILRTRSMPADLNLRWDQRAAVALGFVSLVAACSARPLVAVISASAAIAMNYQFFAFLITRRGLWFALRAVPLHFAYHLNSGLGFALGAAAHFARAPE